MQPEGLCQYQLKIPTGDLRAGSAVCRPTTPLHTPDALKYGGNYMNQQLNIQNSHSVYFSCISLSINGNNSPELHQPVGLCDTGFISVYCEVITDLLYINFYN